MRTNILNMRRFSDIKDFFKLDWILMLLVSILLMFSFAAIYSIDLSRGENLIYFPTQFAAFIIGFVLLVVVSQLHMSFFQSVSKPVYVFSVLLLILLQPDLGSALVFGGIWFGMLILTGVKKRYIFALLVLLSLGFFLSWHYVLEPYQKERLSVFISPEKDLLDSGYNVNQSVIAIGAGNFFGRGLGFGSQSQLHFLPEAQTDFIFSVIAEEMGFVGAFIVLTVFLLFLVKIISIAKDCRDDYGSYVAVGIGLMFFIQLAFNVGGATGILPITGLTLPFVSYGGSSLVINLFLVGILMSISRSNWENQKENVIYG